VRSNAQELLVENSKPWLGKKRTCSLRHSNSINQRVMPESAQNHASSIRGVWVGGYEKDSFMEGTVQPQDYVLCSCAVTWNGFCEVSGILCCTFHPYGYFQASAILWNRLQHIEDGWNVGEGIHEPNKCIDNVEKNYDNFTTVFWRMKVTAMKAKYHLCC